MSAIDTLKYSDRLKEAGVPAALAEAQSRALAETLSSDLLTKADLKEIQGTLNLHSWMLGILISGVAALILKAFF